MRASPLELAGALKIEHQVWRDERGAFVETWNEREFRKLGITSNFVQDNMMRSMISSSICAAALPRSDTQWACP